VARSASLHRRAVCRRPSGDRHRSPHVRTALVFVLRACEARPVASPERIRSHLRAPSRDLGMLPPHSIRHAIRGSQLHHRRVLVHRVNVVRKSSRHHRPRVFGHLRRHPPARCPTLHGSTTGGSRRSDGAFSLACAELTGCVGPWIATTLIDPERRFSMSEIAC
jgi:hypothetical protein